MNVNEFKVKRNLEDVFKSLKDNLDIYSSHHGDNFSHYYIKSGGLVGVNYEKKEIFTVYVDSKIVNVIKNILMENDKRI